MNATLGSPPPQYSRLSDGKAACPQNLGAMHDEKSTWGARSSRTPPVSGLVKALALMTVAAGSALTLLSTTHQALSPLDQHRLLDEAVLVSATPFEELDGDAFSLTAVHTKRARETAGLAVSSR